MTKSKINKPTVMDLFAGCGGLSHGFEKSGYEVLVGIDNWDTSLRTFEKNHNGARTLCGDIQKISPSQVLRDLSVKKTIDVIVGGPPCQGFSISGKRNIDDPRNSLYKTFVHYVGYFKPKAFVMENVPNILSIADGAVRDKIIEDFTSLGYTVTYKVLLASDFGVPQNRRRAFFVGINNHTSFVFPDPTHGLGRDLLRKNTTKDAIGDLPEKDIIDGCKYPTTNKLTEYQLMMRNSNGVVYNHQAVVHTEKTKSIISLVPDGGNYKDLPIDLQKTRKVNIAWTRFSSNKPSNTIDTGHNHHFHYKFNRVPTPREAARLQSFDDNFIFEGRKNEQLKQIGNAVPPLLAFQIAKKLKKYL